MGQNKLSQSVIGSETNSASGPASHTVGDASRYFFFFAMQTIGAAILFWYAIPLFRQVLLDPGGHVARPENLVWSLSAITLMQAVIGYAIDFVCRYRGFFVTHSLATLFYLSPACPSYWPPLFLASSSLCESLNSRYPRPATSLSLLPCSPCSVTRRNSSSWEEH
jgi:hypothetical protein